MVEFIIETLNKEIECQKKVYCDAFCEGCENYVPLDVCTFVLEGAKYLIEKYVAGINLLVQEL